MTPRADLLELSADALTALSNPGLVKRARKDAAEGRLPDIEQLADGTVIARYGDGVVTSLAPATPLRQAACSCPASGVCRHRVTLVLAYQAASNAAQTNEARAWCPSQLAEAVLAMPRATLEQARRLAAARPVLRLTAATPPGARLPMCDVRFFSRTSLALARCDCRQGGNCAHVAVAVWAFVQAAQQRPGFDTVTIELAAPEGATAAPASAAAAADTVAVIDALARRLWLDGTSQNRLALALPFEQALQGAQRLGWCWVVEALDQLRQGIARQEARASGADPETLLHQLTALTLRLAAAHAPQPAMPARQILGIGVKGELALDHLRLLPLGAECWADEGADGVRLIWADPDTMALTVLEKRWPRTSDAPPLRERRLLGAPLHRLAASAVVTKAARRRANGIITIGSGAAQSSVLPLADGAWSTLASPLRQRDLPSLQAYLRTLPPDFARPLQAVEHMHVLPVDGVLGSHWDAAAQVLSASVAVGEHTLLLRLRHEQATASAVDALAAALQGAHGRVLEVAGKVALKGGMLCMTPLALLTTQTMVVPQLAAAPAVALTGAAAPPPGDLNALLARVNGMLAQCLLQGLRHQGRTARAHAQECADALQDAGLAHCAHALRQALDDVASGSGEALAGQLAALHALLEQLARDAGS